MDEQTKRVVEKIGDYSNVSMEQIFQIAQSVQYADFSDEATVRKLVRQLARMANRSVSMEKEDSIVESIMHHEIPSSIEDLQRFFK